MANGIEDIHYSPIRDYRYEQWFREVHYNGKVLNDSERREFLKKVDETIAHDLDGLPLTKKILEEIKGKHDEFHEAQRTIVSVIQFVLMTMIDSKVLGKYFIMANQDYDRRLMRGKLMVVLNEGFKKLYGFDEKTHKNSEWHRLTPLLKYFPNEIRQQYDYLSLLLENHSKSSSWWRDERNVETHLDTEKLYESRCEEIVESKVMMDSQKLFNALNAVFQFLTNMKACQRNFLVGIYQRGELQEE